MRHRCFLTALLLAGMTLVLSGQSLPAQTKGPLRVHPENPRYFADSSSKAVLLTGSHTWPNLVDMGPSDPPPAFENGDGKGIEVHQLARKRVRKIQEAYLHWLVTGLNEFDDLLYEVSNETHPSSTKWQYRVIRYVKRIESSVPKQHPIGMTYQNRRGKNSTAETVAGGAPRRFTASVGEPVVLLLRNVSRS